MIVENVLYEKLGNCQVRIILCFQACFYVTMKYVDAGLEAVQQARMVMA